MEQLSRDLQLTIKSQQYTIHFPKVGELMSIEAKKAELAKGQYGSILDSGTMDSSLVIGFINSIATFIVLAPKLIEDLKVTPTELDLQDAMEIVQVYSKQYFPWFKAWREKLATLAGLE